MEEEQDHDLHGGYWPQTVTEGPGNAGLDSVASYPFSIAWTLTERGGVTESGVAVHRLEPNWMGAHSDSTSASAMVGATGPESLPRHWLMASLVKYHRESTPGRALSVRGLQCC